MHKIYLGQQNTGNDNHSETSRLDARKTFRLARVIQEAGGLIVTHTAQGDTARDPWAWRAGLEQPLAAADGVVIDTSNHNLRTSAELSLALRGRKPTLVLHHASTERQQAMLRNIVEMHDAGDHVQFVSYEETPDEQAETIRAWIGSLTTKTVPVRTDTVA